MPRDAEHKTDAELLEDFRLSGDRYWLGILLERYTLLLFGVCMKYLRDEEAARDTVQQVHLKALIEWEKYPVDYVKSWLYTVARNQCLMKLRTKGQQLVDLDEHGYRLSSDDTSVLLAQEKEVRLEAIEEALAQLSEAQRACIIRFYLEEQSYQQISEITGYSLNEVKSHLQNGKRNLRIIIEKRAEKNG